MQNNFWQDRRVFVTGATGLVGGWVVKHLLKKGADVVALVRDYVPQSHFYSDQLSSKVVSVRGDLSDTLFLERVLGEYEIQTVLHLAAQTIVPIANRNPLSTFESNIAGTWNLLEACRRSSLVKQIVVASSDKAYGDVADLPYNETMPLRAVHPYDVSKACADMITQSYAKSFGVPAVITRCGNFFGGGDLNWNRIVPGTIRSIIRNQQPIIRSDGTLIRDYIYVEDAASAYLSLAEKIAENPSLLGETFNFSNETQLSASQMVQKIIELMQSNLKPVIMGENSGEIQDQYLDSTKAKTLLGWQPVFGLEKGLLATIEWYRKHLLG